MKRWQSVNKKKEPHQITDLLLALVLPVSRTVRNKCVLFICQLVVYGILLQKPEQTKTALIIKIHNSKAALNRILDSISI